MPEFKHAQETILGFMQNVFAMNEIEKRKLKFLYHQGGIETRYSVIPDYSLNAKEWSFYPATENLEPFPGLELRMEWYARTAAPLSVKAIETCIENKINKNEITHLITVSCTGMSAPGLDLQIMEILDLPTNIFRTSVNFMGCYAAIHALKLADALSNSSEDAKVLIVCTELCTLHFQKALTVDNITSSLLFGDGSAAVLVTNNACSLEGTRIKSFYSEVAFKGKKDMSWEISSKGFLMTLSGYIPDLIEEDFNTLIENALKDASLKKEDITDWCIHPGGKKILSSIQKSIGITSQALLPSYDILKNYGNMSSPTILFVLKDIIKIISTNKNTKRKIAGAAFGPGLTMETFILEND